MPRILKLLSVATLLLVLGGCATMNRSECQNADWRTIGMEDGARGRALSYVGNHRKACAAYGISPDLDQYQAGHAQGLRQYCTYSQGLSQGERGHSLREICPQDLAGNFRLGHQRGREIYLLNREIKQTRDDIKNTRKEIDDLTERLHIKEGLIIRKETTSADRVLLLGEVGDLHTRISRLELEFDQLVQHKFDVISQRDELKNRYRSGPN